MKKVRIHKVFLQSFFLIIIVFAVGCAKPTNPESLDQDPAPGPGNGGYIILSKFTTPGFAQDVIKNGNFLYIAQGEGGLFILDVANPALPIAVSTTTDNARGYSTKVAFKDSAVYIAAGNYGVTVFNVANPFAPDVTASNTSMKPARNLHILGEYIFTAISEQGVKIANISEVLHPDLRTTINTSGYAVGLITSLDSNYLLVACGEIGFQMYDISEFNEGFGNYPLAAFCDTKGHAESIVLSDTGKIAFLACGTAGLQIIDYSDTANVFIAGSYSTGGYAKELYFEGNRIYVTTESKGLQIIDVKDISHPTLIGIVPTDYALGIDVDDNYIYIADEDEGLIIVKKPLTR